MKMGGYIVTLAITVGIYIILALGLNIIVGYAGQISLGHAAFWAIGAYTSAILSVKFGLPIWASAIMAVIITTAIGIVLGMPSLRVRDDFLAITTMGINFIVQAVFLYVPFFGGALGIGNIPFPRWGAGYMSNFGYMVMVYIIVAILILVSKWFRASWVGLFSAAMREDELASTTVGIDPRRFKLFAFALGSAYAGIAGVLYAHFMGFISSGDFSFSVSITILSMVVVGGMDTISGPILGAAILVLLPEFFRPIQNYRMLLYGGLLVFMMRYQPQGLLGEDGILRRIFAWEK